MPTTGQPKFKDAGNLAYLEVSVRETSPGTYDTKVETNELALGDAVEGIKFLRAVADNLYAQLVSKLGPDTAFQVLHDQVHAS